MNVYIIIIYKKKVSFDVFKTKMTVTNNKIAFLFPGQGSQRIGMGKNLYNQHKIAKEVFEKIEPLVGYDLKYGVDAGDVCLRLKQY